MPRVSQRKVLIEWFLEGIERDKSHLAYQNLREYLDRHREVLKQRLRDVVTHQRRADPEVSSSLTLSCSVSLSSSDSGSTSLLSSEWEVGRAAIERRKRQRRAKLQSKLVMLQKIMARRYLRDRGGDENRVAKSRDFREDIIGRLPLDRFRHFFRMNPDSFLQVIGPPPTMWLIWLCSLVLIGT